MPRKTFVTTYVQDATVQSEASYFKAFRLAFSSSLQCLLPIRLTHQDCGVIRQVAFLLRTGHVTVITAHRILSLTELDCGNKSCANSGNESGQLF